MRVRRTATIAVIIAPVLAWASAAVADTYNYVSWNAADVAGGTASGKIDLGNDAGVTVTFTALTADGGAGNLYGAQINGAGNDYWIPAATWQSAAVQNGPPNSDIIQLEGGQNETYVVTLSEPIVDPIMAIVSLGSAGATITYDFNSPFTIVSQGTDQWGGSATSLVQLPNNVLQGAEGSGTIQFVGTFSSFSWTAPTPETWHGFTFGVLTSAALYDGGGPDGSTIVIGDGGDDGGDAAPTDAGMDAPPPDAAPSADASLPDATVDASTPDASMMADAASAFDSSFPDASFVDSGLPSVDAGDQGVSASASCGCSTPGSELPGGLPHLAAVALGALLLRRRPRQS
jgi:MYXO-CTERM domain-containing protein